MPWAVPRDGQRSERYGRRSAAGERGGCRLKSTQIKGLPAINVLDGSKVGAVERVFLDPAERRVVGFVIDAHTGFFQPERGMLADTVEVQALGDAALTLLNDAPQGAETTATYDRLVDLNALHGRDVYTEGGVHVGHVTEAEIDERSFTLSAIGVASGSFGHGRDIPVAQVVTIGPEVVVIANAAATVSAPATAGSSATT